jgi:hypothetical protein
MKRIATAVLLASLAVPALAIEIGAPYEQLNIDRQLPNVREPVIDQSAAAGASAATNFSGFKAGAPYEQAQVDRALPSVKDPVVRREGTRVAGPATGIDFTEATGPWANDWNFIAPAP